MTSEADRRGALEAIDRVLNRGGDADDVLRAVVAVLGRLFPYAAVRYVEDGRLVPGPSVGRGDAAVVETRPVRFRGHAVGELAVAGAQPDDTPFIERVALLISPHCLAGSRSRSPTER